MQRIHEDLASVPTVVLFIGQILRTRRSMVGSRQKELLLDSGVKRSRAVGRGCW